MQMPIFDGFNNRYKSEESEANLEAAKSYSRDVAQQITSEVQQALEDIRAKQEKIRTTELQLVQAEQALSLARTQYQVGVITNLDLLVAQTSQHEANLQHIRALYEMIMSRFMLQETIGQKIW
jgi:outer membrane protein